MRRILRMGDPVCIRQCRSAHAQNPAHRGARPETHEQDPAHAHEQNAAHLGKEPTSKKEQPPADPSRWWADPTVRRSARPEALAPDRTAEIDALGAGDSVRAAGPTAGCS